MILSRNEIQRMINATIGKTLLRETDTLAPAGPLQGDVQLGAGIETNAVVAFGSPGPRDGWLYCDGSAVSRTTYSDLFAKIGTTFGNGDGSTTFNIPDYRNSWPHGVP